MQRARPMTSRHAWPGCWLPACNSHNRNRVRNHIMNANQQAQHPKRVLVTGSAGAVGNAVCQYLMARGHTVRGVDIRPTENVPDAIQGDLADKEVVYRAVEQMDTVIHLAAYVNNGDLVETLLRPNVISPFYICEAARDLGVTRLIMASSVQVIEGFGRGERTIRTDEGVKPRKLYALTKAWGETMGAMYSAMSYIRVTQVHT